MEFIIGGFVLAGFLTLYGLLFLYLNTTVPPSPRRGFRAVVNSKLVMLLFALLYLALAHLSVYSSVALGVEWGWKAPCENVVSNSTDYNATVRLYQYTDSCTNRIIPPVAETTFTLLSWLMWIDIFSIVIGSMFLFGRVISRW